MSNTPTTAQIRAAAAKMLGSVLTEEQIAEFLKANKIRTFGKLDTLGRDALAANSKAKTKKTSAASSSVGKYAALSDTPISVKVADNPKRGTCAERFALYFQKGMTVGKFLAAGGQKRDLAWDVRHGYISLGAA